MKTILCIGEDRKIHICKPDRDKAKCGIKVINKKPTDKQLVELYNCCKCSYLKETK